MPKVTILKDETIDQEELKRLLEEAGCPATDEDEDEVEFTDEFDNKGAEDDEPCEPPVLIVVLTPEVCEREGIEGQLREAVNAGCRIVGVWPAGTTDGSPPDVLKKYGAAEVPWNAKAVSAAIGGGQSVHQTPAGEARPAVETDRNCC